MTDRPFRVLALSEAARDGIAFARAIGRGDLDGAWSVFGPKGGDDRMALTIFLAANLYRMVGDDDQEWLDLLHDAEDIPDARY